MPVYKVVSHKIDIEKKTTVVELPDESQCLSVILVNKEPFISFLTKSSQLSLEQVTVVNIAEGWEYSLSYLSSLNYVGAFSNEAHVFHVFTTAEMRRNLI